MPARWSPTLLSLAMRALPIVVLLALAVGCTTTQRPLDPPVVDVGTDLPAVTVADEAAYRAERGALLARLDALIGEAEASGGASCALLPVGAKACGGPTGYRVFDGDAPEADEIVATGRRLVALDRVANETFGLVSTCEAIAVPRVVFAGGRCQIAPAE